MKLKPAAVFSDNCVLQRGKNIIIFGSAPEGQRVEAVLCGNKLNSETLQQSCGSTYVREGRFEIQMPPLEAGVNHELRVSCQEESVLFKNIAVGEVWLAGGQSNMEFELQNCAEREVLNHPPNSMVRFYYTPKKAEMNEELLQAEEESAWECFGDEGTKCWSAVGYFFGAKLQSALGVPVGVIGCNWGGTSASAWMPKEVLEQDAELKIYQDAYDAAVEGKSEEQQRGEYAEYCVYQAEFDRKAGECYAQNPDIEWEEVLKIVGECKWPGPMGCSNPFRPGGLYQCMLSRLAPYSLRGFIYYQGESDDHLPHLYRKLLTRMIEQWREDWREDSLPFIFAQLPMHRYRQDADFKNWCLIREAQNRVFDTVKNTAMACIIDQGEFNDIHPKRKRKVGERLCAQALAFTYGVGDVPEAMIPMLDFVEYGESELVIHIKNTGAGLWVKESAGEESLGFEVAGMDGNYMPAEVKVEDSRIIVSGKKIAHPVYARYLWTNYGDVAVFGAEGMPLAPFRTNRNDGFRPEMPNGK